MDSDGTDFYWSQKLCVSDNFVFQSNCMTAKKSPNDLVRVLKNGRAIEITRRNSENPDFMRENECVLAEPDEFDVLPEGVRIDAEATDEAGPDDEKKTRGRKPKQS